MVMTRIKIKEACIDCPIKERCPLVDEIVDMDHRWVDSNHKMDIHDVHLFSYMQVGEYS